MKIIFALFRWLAVLMIINPAQAQIPLLTFIPLTKTLVSLQRSETVRIEYYVTNQSTKAHTFLMTPLIGINQILSPNHCPSPLELGFQQSCVLTLLVIGHQLAADTFKGGPVFCQQGNPLQCYQPNANDVLDLSIKKDTFRRG